MKVWTYQTDCNNATTANIAFGYAGAGEIINTGIEEKAILKKNGGNFGNKIQQQKPVSCKSRVHNRHSWRYRFYYAEY